MRKASLLRCTNTLIISLCVMMSSVTTSFAQGNTKCPGDQITISSLPPYLQIYLDGIGEDELSNCWSAKELSLVYSLPGIDPSTIYYSYEEKKLPQTKSKEQLAEEAGKAFKKLKFPNLKILNRSVLAFFQIKSYTNSTVEFLRGGNDNGETLEELSLPNLQILSDYALYKAKSLKTVYFPNLKILGSNSLSKSRITTLSLPNATVIGRDALYDVELTKLELTTPNQITISDRFFSSFISPKCDLVLNKNKAPNGTSSPKATDDKHWAGLEWKSITYK